MGPSSMDLFKYPIKRALILGGYGTMGSHIARLLSSEPNCQLLIAGRNRHKAEQFCSALNAKSNTVCRGLGLDYKAPDFAAQLKTLDLDLLIHCAGPFRQQHYRVAEACIAAAIAYIDIADNRRYVCDIVRLNSITKTISIPLISGTGSLPALSSAVLKSFAGKFNKIDTLAIQVAPAQAIIAGPTTYMSTFEARGETYPKLQQGRWREACNGKQLCKASLAHPVGHRWLGNCDAPDLELAPQSIPELQSIDCAVGLQPWPLQLGLNLWAKSARLGTPTHRPWIAKLGHKLARLWPGISPHGGLLIDISGLSVSGIKRTWRWQILGLNGDAPWIAAAPAVAMARKLLHGDFQQPGAQVCWQLLTIDEMLAELTEFAVVTSVAQLTKPQ